MNPSPSKPIGAADDASKRLIIEALRGEDTYGFDVDSIYYIEADDEWILIEFLKCDHRSVRPRDSHPNRYWYNWRKFASLWRLAQELDATLYLVNYEDQSHARAQGRSDREFLIIHVKGMDATERGGITEEEKEFLDFDGFSKWFRAINARGRGTP